MVSVLYQLTHIESERFRTNREDGRQEPPSCPLPHQLSKAISICCVSGTEQLLGVPIRFVAAEAGCFPPGPLTLLADIMETGQKEQQNRGERSSDSGSSG